MNFKTKRLVVIALLAAMCYVGTFINIRIPIGGSMSMVHLGTTAIFIAAVLIGKDAGLAGGIGCALFDLLSDFVAWTIPTLIVKGLTGYVAGKISFANGKEGNSFKYNIAGFIVGGLVSLIGYFISNLLIFGKTWAVAVTSLSTSLVTTTIGVIIAVPLATAVKKVVKKSNLI
ncbi:ECF transporter S component [Clostridium septicum]|uniref:ECF transporter S component n=1 Tax=Clostridium septicum TaxID=1504 RepID=A0A9N7JPL3_CLOSE|nr:ECF transporter S component [Clostridium septicum]AYE35736.1 ECF transporter S component [Clostridium septicum]QAS61075.1 ECF transporter S component [Clostridium septicum]UEC19590.1 ECF transporter S component [Clostridium septicum]USS02351.1 ECF transporter S component [Clostridium septicum]WLF70931.1 ECF transporter S component [Clostridium septicum]